MKKVIFKKYLFSEILLYFTARNIIFKIFSQSEKNFRTSKQCTKLNIFIFGRNLDISIKMTHTLKEYILRFLSTF